MRSVYTRADRLKPAPPKHAPRMGSWQPERPLYTTIFGLITATTIGLPAAVSLPNMASSSYVPTIAPPDPAKFAVAPTARAIWTIRSEEHTSELQSLRH